MFELYDCTKNEVVERLNAHEMATTLERMFHEQGMPHVDEFYLVTELGGFMGLEEMGEMTPLQFMGYYEECLA